MWLITGQADEAAITAIDTYLLTNQARSDIVVGRRDGNVDVFSFNGDMDVGAIPTRIFRLVRKGKSAGAVGCACVLFACVEWPLPPSCMALWHAQFLFLSRPSRPTAVPLLSRF